MLLGFVWLAEHREISQPLVLTLMKRKVKVVKNYYLPSLSMLIKHLRSQENLIEFQPCWETVYWFPETLQTAFLGPEGGGVCSHPSPLVSSNDLAIHLCFFFTGELKASWMHFEGSYCFSPDRHRLTAFSIAIRKSFSVILPLPRWFRRSKIRTTARIN